MLDIFFSEAFAEAAKKATTEAAPSPFASLLPFVLIFGVFYFLMIRPQKKKMQEEKALLSALGKGDEVFTKSGLIGTITGLTEKIVTLEVDNGVKLKILRGQIGGLAKSLFEKKEEQKK